jgi:hypothetical protein
VEQDGFLNRRGRIAMTTLREAAVNVLKVIIEASGKAGFHLKNIQKPCLPGRLLKSGAACAAAASYDGLVARKV